MDFIFITAFLSGIIHILFFVLESLLFTRPTIYKIFGISKNNVEVTRLLFFNQGFYNLFLAIGTFAGIYLYMENQGVALLVFTSSCMVGAALALLSSKRSMYRGAFLQGFLPLITLILLLGQLQ